MSYATIDLKSKEKRPKLRLCKPNREPIYPLNEIFGLNLQVSSGQISTLSFSFNSKVLRNNKFVDNPLLEHTIGNMLVEMKFKGITSYFLIVKHSKSYSSNSEIVNIECSLQGYELSKLSIRGIEETSRSIRDLSSLILSESVWTIDFVDADIARLFRSYETSSSTVLQAIYDIANSFGAIPAFDSNRRTISYYSPENYGINKGITLKEGKFLESFDLQINDEDVVTRLVYYGENGTDFRSLTPTASNYLQDFSYFLAPFEVDENYNIIRSSKYMSDDLALALVRYEELTRQISGSFNVLTQAQLETQNTIANLQRNLSDLNTQLTNVNVQIDVLNYTYGESASMREDHIQAVRMRENILSSIASDLNVISQQNAELENIQNQIQDFRIQISSSRNFTEEQLNELSFYIRTREESNDTISDPQELLNEATKRFEEVKQPPFSLSIAINAFAEYFDVTLIDQLSLGDTVRLKSQKLKADVIANISSIVWDFDNFDATITLENVRGYETGENKFARQLQNSINTSNNVSINSYRWRQGEQANTLINEVLNNEFNAARNVIVGGTNNTVRFGDRGIYNEDRDDPNTFMVINNGILAITPDGGNTVSVAISKNGVHAEQIFGRLIFGENLQLESDEGILRARGSGINIYNADNELQVQLGRFSNPFNEQETVYGLNIMNGAFSIRSSTDGMGGVVFNGQSFSSYNTNGARTFHVDFQTGRTTIVGSLEIKAISGENRGVTLTSEGLSSYNGSGIRNYHLDNEGNLTANSADITGVINATGGIISGNLRVTGSFNGGSIIGADITGATFTGGRIDIDTDATVGRILRVGRFVDFTNDSAALVFGDQSTLENNAYVRATYVFGNTALTMNAGAGITIATREASIRLNAPVIDANGNINMQAASPSEKTSLGIVSNTNSQGMVVSFFRDDSFNPVLGYMGFNDSSNIMTIKNNSGMRIALETNGTSFRVNSNGVSVRTLDGNNYLPIAASAFEQNSKRDSKKNILEFKENALEKIANSKIYHYNYNNESDSDLKHLGLIVEEAPKEIVNKSKDSVDIYAMNSILWKAVQELSDELKKLKKEIF